MMMKLPQIPTNYVGVGTAMRGSFGPVVVDVSLLLVVCIVSVGFSSATDLGRSGSSYPGYVVLAVVAGAMTAYRPSRSRRFACFFVLLLALVGMNSEKEAHEGFRNMIARAKIKHVQTQVEQLANTQSPTGSGEPTTTP